MAELLRVDLDEWNQKAPLFREHDAQFGDKLPKELARQLDALEERLGRILRTGQPVYPAEPIAHTS